MRPRRCRRVWREPSHIDFRPPGSYWKAPVVLTVDEFEALRLKHLKKLDQTEAARTMNISQPTFHRTIDSAHEKITRALQDGCGIRIKGGDYMTEEEKNNLWHRQRERIQPRYFVSQLKSTGGDSMTEEKGVPKRDGSGKGARANRGRGGCEPSQDKNARCGRPRPGRGFRQRSDTP